MTMNADAPPALNSAIRIFLSFISKHREPSAPELSGVELKGARDLLPILYLNMRHGASFMMP